MSKINFGTPKNILIIAAIIAGGLFLFAIIVILTMLGISNSEDLLYLFK